MERLTRRMCGGWGMVEGYELNTLRGMRATVNKLAAYENTGMSPEEIEALKREKGGWDFDRACPNCGEDIDVGWSNCPYCGQHVPSKDSE